MHRNERIAAGLVVVLAVLGVCGGGLRAAETVEYDAVVEKADAQKGTIVLRGRVGGPVTVGIRGPNAFRCKVSNEAASTPLSNLKKYEPPTDLPVTLTDAQGAAVGPEQFTSGARVRVTEERKLVWRPLRPTQPLGPNSTMFGKEEARVIALKLLERGAGAADNGPDAKPGTRPRVEPENPPEAEESAEPPGRKPGEPPWAMVKVESSNRTMLPSGGGVIDAPKKIFLNVTLRLAKPLAEEELRKFEVSDRSGRAVGEFGSAKLDGERGALLVFLARDPTWANLKGLYLSGMQHRASLLPDGPASGGKSEAKTSASGRKGKPSARTPSASRTARGPGQTEKEESGASGAGKVARGFRTWRDASGKHEIEAVPVDCRDGKAHLKKRDGRTVTVAVEKLSPADQAYLRKAFPPKNSADDHP